MTDGTATADATTAAHATTTDGAVAGGATAGGSTEDLGRRRGRRWRRRVRDVVDDSGEVLGGTASDLRDRAFEARHLAADAVSSASERGRTGAVVASAGVLAAVAWVLRRLQRGD